MSKNKYEFTLDTNQMNDSHMGLAVRIKPKQRVLELGCSSGYLTKFLKEELGCSVVGVDIDSDVLKKAKVFCKQVITADLDNDDWLAEIKGQQFDVVLCADVLEHLKSPVDLLKKLKPFLHDDSRVLASVPNVAHISIRLELLQGHFDYESLGLLDDTHLHFYTRNGLISMLMQAGYICSDISYSIQDLADEAIDQHLKTVGLKASKLTQDFFHAEDAVAYQFIIEARPAKSELVQHLPQPLMPKPLKSSGAFYAEKQEKIGVLEQKIERLEQQRDNLQEERLVERKHSDNHQKNIIQLEKKLRVMEERLEGEYEHNRNHLKNAGKLKDQLLLIGQQLMDEKEHNLNHKKNTVGFKEKLSIVEKQLNGEKEHSKNHQKNAEGLKENLNVIKKQLDGEKEHSKNHQKNAEGLKENLNIIKKQLDGEKEHNKNHQKNALGLKENLNLLEKQLGGEKEHNKNHLKAIQAWQETTSVLDVALFDFTDKLNDEKKTNSELSAQNIALEEAVEPLRAAINHLTVDNQRLESVLQTVHDKFSYRLVRGIKDAPKIAGELFQKTEYSQVHNTDVDANESESIAVNHHDYPAWLAEFGVLDEHKLAQLKSDISEWENTPKIAILMPVYNPDSACLINAIESVLQQVYTNFELCIADDASTEPHVREILQEYEQKDQRIKVAYRKENGHISAASNTALELVEAEYVALMDHDDLLTKDALYWIVKTINQHPDVQLIYSDEDKMDIKGNQYAPYFKPDWNPELFLSHNFICHLGVYKTEKVRVLKGFDSAFDGAQDYDLVLRYADDLTADQIVHIPHILYHWRAVAGSTANGVHEKPYAEAVILKAVECALKRKKRGAKVLAHEELAGALRVNYSLPDKFPLVSIIMPTRNGFELLRRCVESIFERTTYSNFELIIIDNGSDDLVAMRYLQRLQEDKGVTVIRDNSPFNYAALNNKAVAQAKGEIIALLNNDLEVINDGWLDEMVSHVIHSEVGAVGAKLYYPDDTIQHAGVIVGLGGVAGHSHKHFPRDHPGYCGRLLLTQNLSAVTAACLLVRKEVFDAVGGFDAKNLSVAFNDVDLCLRIQEQGFYNVWTPYAEMYHYESATRGYEDTPEKQARFNGEVEYMKQRWGEGLLIDPAYNPNLTLDREDFSFAWPPRS